MIYASTLKKYLVESVGYNKWGDINLLLPGLDMKKVAETRKLSKLTQTEPVVTPA
jgi:hypothetical protein